VLLGSKGIKVFSNDVCCSNAKGPRDNKGVSKRSGDGDDNGDREFMMLYIIAIAYVNLRVIYKFVYVFTGF
jgi:hypothetical protein